LLPQPARQLQRLTLIGVLTQLRRFLRGAPATVVWDNLPCHTAT
jgi:hypothetical protein